MIVRYDIGTDNGWNEISFVPEREKTPILIECAIPFLAAGRLMSPQEALDDRWAESFTKAKAEWFLPLLRRMAAGELVTLSEIQEAYQKERGVPLKSVEDPRAFADNL